MFDLLKLEAKYSHQVSLKHLFLNAEQLASLTSMYTASSHAEITRQTFAMDPASQQAARAFLVKHGLDLEARNQLESKWSTVWSTTWKVDGGSEIIHRVLVQW